MTINSLPGLNNVPSYFSPHLSLLNMTLYIIRHGETEFNRLQIVQGSGVDSDLNHIGYEQARAFHETYQDIDFQLVVTSKLRRTQQTVRHFLDKNIPWIETADINEISWGTHEGLPATPERTALYLEMINHWKSGNFDASLPEGETAAQLAGTCRSFCRMAQNPPRRTHPDCHTWPHPSLPDYSVERAWGRRIWKEHCTPTPVCMWFIIRMISLFLKWKTTPAIWSKCR